jgi:CHAT domain-containing protein
MYKAFEYAERSKAAILLSALRTTEAKSFGNVPDSLLEKENNLMRDIALYKEFIYEEKSHENNDVNKLKNWEKKLFEISNEYDNLITFFEDSFPKYYSLKYNTGVIDISSLQQALKWDQALIEYSLSDTSLFMFHVEKRRMNIIHQSIDSTFHKSLSTIINFLNNFDCSKTPVEDLTDYVDKSYYLYNILVKPVETYTKNKRLVIVPDELLSFLPFEALIDSRNINGRTSYRNLNYLIHKYIISYGISSTLYFRESPDIQGERIRKLSAFAPVYDKPINTADILIRTRQYYRDKLYPIPGVKDEVNSISKIIDCDIFEGVHATERIFKDTARYYDLLHLSMHTIINNTNPMFSKLAFTEVNDSIEDGLLNTHEIYNMNINARLAVLSSCSSGEGILKKGEGVMSLARAFMYAGCPSIVMTLWVVEDKSSIRLMTEFYKEIAKGMPKDKALRNSKLKFIEEENLTRAHPFYWSSYICVGTPEPLFYSAKKIILIISTIILAIVALILLKRILKIRKPYQTTHNTSQSW